MGLYQKHLGIGATCRRDAKDRAGKGGGDGKGGMKAVVYVPVCVCRCGRRY